jgi:hypothetical protein
VIPTALTSVQWSAIGSIGAAVAALSALATIIFNAWDRRVAQRPHLTIQPLNYADVDQVHYKVTNAGGGQAIGCGFVLTAGRWKLSGPLGDMVLQPGESAYISTPMPSGAADVVRGALMARDRWSVYWGWSTEEHAPRKLNTRRSRRKTGGISLRELLHAFYPDINLKELTKLRYVVGQRREDYRFLVGTLPDEFPIFDEKKDDWRWGSGDEEPPLPIADE